MSGRLLPLLRKLGGTAGRMFKAAPNVVVEETFRKLLERGYRAEIVCAESATKQHATWYGRWYLRAVSDENGEEHLLVTARGRGEKDLAPRYFRTVPGLISFLYDQGCKFVDIPLEAGTRALQRRQGKQDAAP